MPTSGTIGTNLILNKARQQADTVADTTATPATASDIAGELEVADKSDSLGSSASMQAVQEALATSTARSVANIQQLESNLTQQNTISDVIVSSIQDITSAAVLEEKAKGIANLQAQNATINSFEAGGGQEAQVALMETLQQDGARLASLLDERADIVDDKHTGIALIDSIINEFRGVQNELEVGVAQQQQQQTTQQISNINAANESNARVNAVTKRTLNESVIEAQYKQIEAESAVRGKKAELSNLRSNAVSLSNMMNASNDVLNNRLRARQIEDNEEDRQLQREKMELQREQMAIEREMLKTKLPAAKIALSQAELNLAASKDAAPTVKAQRELQLEASRKSHNELVATENAEVEAVQAGQSIILGEGGIEDREIILRGLNNRNAKVRARYEKALEVGLNPRGNLGVTPFDARESYSTVAPSGNFVKTAGSKLLQEIDREQSAKYQKNKQLIPKANDITKISADYNATAAEVIARHNKEIKTGDLSNPLHAPPMNVLADVSAVAQSSLYKNVLASKNMKEINPKTILDAAVNSTFAVLKPGEPATILSPEEAAESVVTIFTAAADYNSTVAGGFSRVGLPNQTEYNVRVEKEATAFDVLSTRVSVFGTPSVTLRLREKEQRAAAALAAIKGEEFKPKTSAELLGDVAPTFFDIDLMNVTQVLAYIISARTKEIKTTAGDK